MKRASGGRVQVPGKQVIEEAYADNDGFKRGGKAKDGGMADGKKSAARMDKPRRAAGGAVPRAMRRGGSAMSAAGSGGENAPSRGSECG